MQEDGDIIGKNAAWGICLLYGEVGFKYPNWYMPGLLEIYRQEEAGQFDNNMSLYSEFKMLGIDYTEKDLNCFINMIKHGLKLDLEKSPKAILRYEKDENLNEIIILIFEAESFIAKAVGYKYRYFFIREEKGLGIYSTVVGNWNFIEGSKKELIDYISAEKKIVAQFSFYLSWEWEL